MLELLSKLKHDCFRNGIDLINSQITGDSIKLSCELSGRRDTEINAYITPSGDKYQFRTVTPNGKESEPIEITEAELIPTLKSVVNPSAPKEVVVTKEEDQDGGMDEVKIEVADGVYDTKLVPHGTYNNSRYAYSDKYHKMGTIDEIRRVNSINWIEYKMGNIAPMGGIYDCPILVLKNFDRVIKNLKEGKEWPTDIEKDVVGVSEIPNKLVDDVAEGEIEYFYIYDEKEESKLAKEFGERDEPMYCFLGDYGFGDIVTEKAFKEFNKEHPEYKLKLEKLPSGLKYTGTKNSKVARNSNSDTDTYSVYNVHSFTYKVKKGTDTIQVEPAPGHTFKSSPIYSGTESDCQKVAKYLRKYPEAKSISSAELKEALKNSRTRSQHTFRRRNAK